MKNDCEKIISEESLCAIIYDTLSPSLVMLTKVQEQCIFLYNGLQFLKSSNRYYTSLNKHEQKALNDTLINIKKLVKNIETGLIPIIDGLDIG